MSGVALARSGNRVYAAWLTEASPSASGRIISEDRPRAAWLRELRCLEPPGRDGIRLNGKLTNG